MGLRGGNAISWIANLIVRMGSVNLTKVKTWCIVSVSKDMKGTSVKVENALINAMTEEYAMMVIVFAMMVSKAYTVKTLSVSLTVRVEENAI